MMQQLCAFTERANASAARVVDVASALFGNLSKGLLTTGTPAICTHGKCYERRPQEMLT